MIIILLSNILDVSILCNPVIIILLSNILDVSILCNPVIIILLSNILDGWILCNPVIIILSNILDVSILCNPVIIILLSNILDGWILCNPVIIILLSNILDGWIRHIFTFTVKFMIYCDKHITTPCPNHYPLFNRLGADILHSHIDDRAMSMCDNLSLIVWAMLENMTVQQLLSSRMQSILFPLTETVH